MRKILVSRYWIVILLFSMVCAGGAAAKNGPEDDFDVIDWGLAKKRMKMLSPMGYHPFLMPLIMENRDAIGLSNEQIKVFRQWRSKNRVPLLHAMNRIIQEHKKVLEYQLSCRRNILDTFTDEQWDEFRFVLTENGYELD